MYFIGTRRAVAASIAVLVFTSFTLANHGPGASGGGSSTISGETLKQGHAEFSLREDYSRFEHFDDRAAIAEAERAGDFDSLDQGFITTADISYGITDDFQLGATIGYFAGH